MHLCYRCRCPCVAMCCSEFHSFFLRPFSFFFNVWQCILFFTPVLSLSLCLFLCVSMYCSIFPSSPLCYCCCCPCVAVCCSAFHLCTKAFHPCAVSFSVLQCVAVYSLLHSCATAIAVSASILVSLSPSPLLSLSHSPPPSHSPSLPLFLSFAPSHSPYHSLYFFLSLSL